MITKAYKVFSHTLCSPLQGGDPVWDGTVPHDLPSVEVDTGGDECAAGWNACREAHTALRIAGLWCGGWPARLFEVETEGEVVERGDKLRAATWRVVCEVTDLRPAIERLSNPFGEHARVMVDEQLAWHRALCRPKWDERSAAVGLKAALDARGLAWGIKHFDSARAARDAGAAWDAWDAGAAGAAWDAWDAGAAWDAWAARAAWDAWDAGAAWDAMNAMIVRYASLMGWIAYAPDLLTVGIRDAYEHGLAIAIPAGPQELGYAMVAQEDRR